MKKNVFVKSGLVAALALFMSACSSDNGEETSEQQPSPSPEEVTYQEKIALAGNETAYVDGTNTLAFNMLKAMSAGEKGVVASPMSLASLIGMLSNGGSAQTQQEAKELLGISTTDMQAVNAFFHKMITQAPLVDAKVTLQQGSAIYVNQPYQLRTDYATEIGKTYKPELQTADFREAATTERINQWVSQLTKGMIPQLLQQGELNPSAAVCAVNALYFHAPWMSRFDKSETKSEAFAGGGQVMMMHQKGIFNYREDSRTQTLYLPYGNGAFAMTVILPKEGVSLADAVAQFDGRNWRNSWNMAGAYEVDVKMPRLENKTQDNGLAEWLKQQMPSAFSQQEGFDRMCDSRVWISSIKQEARIMADEEGATAAAATISEMTTAAANDDKPQTVVFHANRPFIYTITERSTGAIFFVGTYHGE